MNRKRGIKRLIVAFGLICAVLIVLFLLFSYIDDFFRGCALIVVAARARIAVIAQHFNAKKFWIGVGGRMIVALVVLFLLWGFLRLVGWVVDGFSESGSD